MNMPVRGRQISLTFVTIVVALAFTSHALNAKKPPKPDPDPPDPPPVLYEVTWLVGDQPDDCTQALDVNRWGEFVGSMYALGAGTSEAFLGDAGNPVVQDLNVVLDIAGVARPGKLTEAIGINNYGRIAGHYATEEYRQLVFVLDEAPIGETDVVQKMPRINGEDGQTAIRLGEDGTVVGSISIPDDGSYPFVWTPGNDPIVLWELEGRVTGINQGGAMVGTNFEAMFHYAGGALIDLGPTSSYLGRWPDINDDGIIAGTVWQKKGKGNGVYAAKRAGPDGQWQYLGSDGSGSVAINDNGQICGIHEQGNNAPGSVFVYNPNDDSYWVIDDLLAGDPDDVADWKSGDTSYDNEPAEMSDAIIDVNGDGFLDYGYIVGWKFGEISGMFIRSTGFVLTPFYPDP